MLYKKVCRQFCYMKKSIYIIFMIQTILTGCAATPQDVRVGETEKQRADTIYLAGGCFWGTQRLFSLVPGVMETEAGYANSTVPYPTYKDVCSGKTGAAECVKVVYNPYEVTLPYLLRLYFKSVDPSTLNRQGNDVGTQYRTGIYYSKEEDKPVIERQLSILQDKNKNKIVIESGEIRNFYPAEEYHQEYLEKNPGGYCHVAPQLFVEARRPQYSKPEKSELESRLTPLQYGVTQQNKTELPYSNEYWNEKRRGIYVDITTGEPLFISTDKFDSGCGWPSFTKPISESLIKELPDTSHGMQRVEVRSKNGDAHLGHVFEDGPKDRGGLRYCINSAALRFIPEKDMAKEGYAAYLELLGNE